jgi:hypothetical protein
MLLHYPNDAFDTHITSIATASNLPGLRCASHGLGFPRKRLSSSGLDVCRRGGGGVFFDHSCSVGNHLLVLVRSGRASSIS